MTSISALTASDVDEWLPLWHGYLTFYESDLPDDVTAVTFRRLVAGDGMYGALARDDEGTAVGFVNWLPQASTWTTASYCYLEDLYVTPGVRGGGVGRALVAHVREWAESNGCAQVYWLTQESNDTARMLYDKVAHLSGFVHYEIAL
jgi:GNAT superfamily N-acetyltransferase